MRRRAEPRTQIVLLVPRGGGDRHEAAPYRDPRGLGWRWGRTRYQALSLGLPLLYCLALYVPVWISGLGMLGAPRLAVALVIVGLAFWVKRSELAPPGGDTGR